MSLYDKIIDQNLLVRRINIVACKLLSEEDAKREKSVEQLNFFTDYDQIEREKTEEERDKNRQKAILGIKKKFGKNAILKGMNLQEGATAKDRNSVKELKEDMKEMKLAQAKQGKVLKTLCIVMCVLTVIVGGFFVYIWRHDAELAKSILSLGTTIGSLVA